MLRKLPMSKVSITQRAIKTGSAALFSVLLLVSASGCKNNREAFDAANASLEAAYRSSDMNAAESALLEHVVFLENQRAKGARLIDYEQVLGLTKARLWRLHEKQGKQAEASKCFREATNHMAKFAVQRKMPLTPIAREEVIRLVDHADANLAPKWKVP
jgi:hypothetical protein